MPKNAGHDPAVSDIDITKSNISSGSDGETAREDANDSKNIVQKSYPSFLCWEDDEGKHCCCDKAGNMLHTNHV